MDEVKKNRWVQEYESLPEWLRNFIDAFRKVHGYGENFQGFPGCRKNIQLFVLIHSEDADALFCSVIEMKRFCDALSAPAEHPVLEGYSARFQCQYLDIVPGAALCYCHEWPDKPHKCHRTWDEEGYRMKDCPGFAPNPNYKMEESKP